MTVPIGLHVLGAIGTVAGWRDKQSPALAKLATGAIVFFLILFSTRIPVYDGERLFLLIFPLWALLIGRGFVSVWNALGGRPLGRKALVLVLLTQAMGVISTYPFGLSYYNSLVGGLRGAERLGLELTYWNDAVDGVLLDQFVREAKVGETAALAPTLYPTQGLASTTRAMARGPLLLRDEDKALKADWVVVSRRTAYWKPALAKRLEQGQLVASRSRQGVWLSGLWRFPPSAKTGVTATTDSPPLPETRASP